MGDIGILRQKYTVLPKFFAFSLFYALLFDGLTEIRIFA